MNMTLHGIVDIKGCQHSKHIAISVFQTECFPEWVKIMYLLENIYSEALSEGVLVSILK